MKKDAAQQLMGCWSRTNVLESGVAGSTWAAADAESDKYICPFSLNEARDQAAVVTGTV
jgi:hypothetical protein